jgi:hypothetical protein
VVGAKDSRPAHSGLPVVALSLLLQVLAAMRSSIHSLIRNVIVRNQGQRFCPCQSRSFALAVIRRLSPGNEPIEALLALTVCPCILAMYIDAVGASVDL